MPVRSQMRNVGWTERGALLGQMSGRRQTTSLAQRGSLTPSSVCCALKSGPSWPWSEGWTAVSVLEGPACTNPAVDGRLCSGSWKREAPWLSFSGRRQISLWGKYTNTYIHSYRQSNKCKIKIITFYNLIWFDVLWLLLIGKDAKVKKKANNNKNNQLILLLFF